MGSRRVLRSPTEAGGGPSRVVQDVDTAQKFKDILADLGFSEDEYKEIMREGNEETMRLLIALHAATDPDKWTASSPGRVVDPDSINKRNEAADELFNTAKAEFAGLDACEADVAVCIGRFEVSSGYDATLANRMIRAAEWRVKKAGEKKVAAGMGELTFLEKPRFGTTDPLVRTLISMAVKRGEGEQAEFLVSAETIKLAEARTCRASGRVASDFGKIREDWNARQGQAVPSRREVPGAERVVPTRAGPEEVGPRAPTEERVYPEYIVDKTIQDMLKTFAEEASDFNLEKIQMRAEYLAQKGTLTASEKAEVEALNEWLAGLGFAIKGRISERMGKLNDKIREKNSRGESVEAELEELNKLQEQLVGQGLVDSPLDALLEMRQGFFMIQSLYYQADEGGTELINYMKQVEATGRDGLFLVCKRYLSGLDENAGKLFLAVKPGDPGYIKKVGEAMRVRLSEESVKAGRAAWVEYFQEFSAEEDREKFSLAMQYALSKVGLLSPLLAAEFHDYLEIVRKSGLSSPEERKNVVRTAAQLYAVNPFLVGKYFQAIANLAIVCEDNTIAFRDSMAHLSAKIEAIANPIVEEVSALQFMPSNVRTIVTRLDNALEEVSKIPPAALSQYDRFNLMDDFVYRWRHMPHPIMQAGPKYAPGFLVPLELMRPYASVYPFPEHLAMYRPLNMFSAGSVYANPEQYRGAIIPPRFNLMRAVSHTEEVKGSLDAYLWPAHAMVSFGDTIPGVAISGLSATRLLMEIDRAFIPTERPEYSMKPLGGGAAVGGEGRKYAETGEREFEMGGMGTYITPTGGIALGGSVAEEQRLVAGTMVGVPVYKVQKDAQGKVGGVDSLIGGYQETDVAAPAEEGPAEGEEAEEPLTAKERRYLAEAIATKWNPTNPGQLFVTVVGEENYEGKKFMSARTFFVEKDGTIYELMGGLSDYVEAHNFIAGYGNQNIDLPATYAWNVEPTIDRGGGAIAWDAGETGWLAHVQAVPFYTPVKEGLPADATPEEIEAAREAAVQEKPMPLLFQWTPAMSWTDNEEKEVKIHIISTPGSHLELEPSESDKAQGRPSDKYLIQDVRYRMKYIKEKRAWELSTGAGLGEMEVARRTGEEGEWGKDSRMIGRGGFFLKTQSRLDRYSRAGGGAYYEAGATNMMALALMNEAEEDRRYIESLHRIGMTVYGGGRAADELVMGGLIHVLEQIREMGGEERPVSEGGSGERVSGPDFRSGDYEGRTFYRLIGILKGLRNISGRRIESESGAKLDVMRAQGLERILTDYESLAGNLQQDPRNAAYMVRQFREKYAAEIRQIFDYYSLGTQITKNFSLQGVLVMRERDNVWVKQELDKVHMKQLWTFKLGKRFGFQRAWASVPLLGRYLHSAGTQRVGLLGAGAGIDLFTGKFLPRIAADAGLVLAKGVALYELDREEREGLEAAETEQPGTIARFIRENRDRWDRRGYFVQGAILAFSNVLEDSNDYRNLVADFENYKRYIRMGKFSKLPPSVRKKMCEGLDGPESRFNSELLKKIRKGEDIPVDYEAPKKGELGLGPEEVKNIEAAASVKKGRKLQVKKEYKPYLGDIRQGTFSRIPPKLRADLAGELKKKNFPAWIAHGVANGKDIPLKKDVEAKEAGWLSEYEVQDLEDSLWANDFLDKKAAIQKKFDGHWRNYYAGSMYDMGRQINWDVGAFVEWVDGLKKFQLYGIYSKKEEGSVFTGASVQLGRPGKGTFELDAVAGIPVKHPKLNTMVSLGYGWKAGEIPMKISAAGFHFSTVVPEHTAPFSNWPWMREFAYSEWVCLITLTIGPGGVPQMPMGTRAPRVADVGQRR